jgi:hypothetical protein
MGFTGNGVIEKAKKGACCLVRLCCRLHLNFNVPNGSCILLFRPLPVVTVFLMLSKRRRILEILKLVFADDLYFPTVPSNA